MHPHFCVTSRKGQSMYARTIARRFGPLPLMVLSLVLAACDDAPLTPSPIEELAPVANVAPQTHRTGKGDLVTGEPAAFAQALKEIGPDGEVLVWLKETTTHRPS